MTVVNQADMSVRLEDLLTTVDDEIENTVTSGGIPADTRGDLGVDYAVANRTVSRREF